MQMSGTKLSTSNLWTTSLESDRWLTDSSKKFRWFPRGKDPPQGSQGEPNELHDDGKGNKTIWILLHKVSV